MANSFEQVTSFFRSYGTTGYYTTEINADGTKLLINSWQLQKNHSSSLANYTLVKTGTCRLYLDAAIMVESSALVSFSQKSTNSATDCRLW